MFVDKQKAKSHKWRIKERTLFTISLIGGAIGGFFGMFCFHHKNRKPKFYIIYFLGLLIHSYIVFQLWKNGFIVL